MQIRGYGSLLNGILLPTRVHDLYLRRSQGLSATASLRVTEGSSCVKHFEIWILAYRCQLKLLFMDCANRHLQ